MHDFVEEFIRPLTMNLGQVSLDGFALLSTVIGSDAAGYDPDPVVLVDRVEVTAPQSPNAIYVLRTVETMLRCMQFKPSLSDKLSGQRLSLADIQRCWDRRSLIILSASSSPVSYTHLTLPTILRV